MQTIRIKAISKPSLNASVLRASPAFDKATSFAYISEFKTFARPDGHRDLLLLKSVIDKKPKTVVYLR